MAHRITVRAASGAVSYREGRADRRTLTISLPSNPAKARDVIAATTVEWVCHRRAAILFDTISPFTKRRYKGGETAKLRIDVSPGRYKYIVAVPARNGIVIDDPDVVVDYTP
jgi:hypothetical protein